MYANISEFTRLRDSARYVKNQQSFIKIQSRADQNKFMDDATDFPHEKPK